MSFAQLRASFPQVQCGGPCVPLHSARTMTQIAIRHGSGCPPELPPQQLHASCIRLKPSLLSVRRWTPAPNPESQNEDQVSHPPSVKSTPAPSVKSKLESKLESQPSDKPNQPRSKKKRIQNKWRTDLRNL